MISLLERIRTSNNMLDKDNLQNLRAFYHGFADRCMNLNVDVEYFTGLNLQGFNEWVAKQLGQKGTTLNAFLLIGMLSDNDENGFRYFFQLYDDYILEMKNESTFKSTIDQTSKCSIEIVDISEILTAKQIHVCVGAKSVTLLKEYLKGTTVRLKDTEIQG